MNLHFPFGLVISLIAGILVMVMPGMLNYVVSFFLIIIGVIGLLAQARPVSDRSRIC